jgi:hypothetical protein
MNLFSRSVVYKRVISLAATTSVAITSLALAQGSTPAEHASAAAKATNYLPSISDFMIATIQPRHVGLWVAAHNKDWPFAAYELGNLKGAFGRLGQAHPMEHEIPLQDMISSVTAQPFENLRKATLAKDATAFDKPMATSPPLAMPVTKAQTMAWSSFERRRTHPFQTRILGVWFPSSLSD